MNNKYESIIQKLMKWKTCGERTLDNGTRLICHVPHVAPEAWFHEIYPSLDEMRIEEIAIKTGGELPKDLIEFLRCTNGINVFSDSLRLYGFRTSYVRTGDEAIQPYDLISANMEKERDMPKTWLLIGGYRWDGSSILYDLGLCNNKVYRCDPDSNAILQEWDSLWSLLDLEIDRLSELYDGNGVKYDKDTPTVPETHEDLDRSVA